MLYYIRSKLAFLRVSMILDNGMAGFVEGGKRNWIDSLWMHHCAAFNPPGWMYWRVSLHKCNCSITIISEGVCLITQTRLKPTPTTFSAHTNPHYTIIFIKFNLISFYESSLLINCFLFLIRLWICFDLVNLKWTIKTIQFLNLNNRLA